MRRMQVLCRNHWCGLSWVSIEKLKKEHITPAECTGLDGPYNYFRWVKRKSTSA